MNAHPQMLRSLGVLARLGVAGLVLTMLGGTAASGIYLNMHHGDRDQRDGLTVNDVRAHYHGVVSPSVLIESLDSGHPERLADRERSILLEWLRGDAAQLSLEYDNLDRGEDAPAEILFRACADCHSRSADGEDAYPELPLDYWDDVYSLAASTDIRPVDTEILAASTHTHALGMASMGLVMALLMFFTTMPRVIVSPVIAVTGVGLIADIGGWWLTRIDDTFAWMVVIGGVGFSAGMTVMSLLILIELCLPKPVSGGNESNGK